MITVIIRIVTMVAIVVISNNDTITYIYIYMSK